MLDRTAERFGLKPKHLAADSAWIVRQSGLAGQGAADRAAHPGVRQVEPHRRDLRARRLRFRSGTEPLHLPGRKATDAVPTLLYDPTHRHHQGGDPVVPCQPVRLPELRPSNRAAALTHPGARCRGIWTRMLATSPERLRGRLPSSALGTTERDRDAVCPPQAHPPARALEVAQTQRGERRVPASPSSLPRTRSRFTRRSRGSKTSSSPRMWAGRHRRPRSASVPRSPRS
jgi:hypothetical protein